MLDRELAQVEAGDVLALMSAGAYGFTKSQKDKRGFEQKEAKEAKRV